jgi:signal transduction histidine kinase
MPSIPRTLSVSLSLLLVSNNREEVVRVEQEIRRRSPRGRIKVVDTVEKALGELRAREHDVVVVDLPDLEALTLITTLRQEALDLPVVVLVEDPSNRASLGIVNAGADQCVTKEGAYHQTLPRILEAAIRFRSLARETRKLEDRLHDRDNTQMLNIVTGTLSHEINNPLMTILGTTELLLDRTEGNDPETRRKLQMIQQSARRIQLSLATLASSTEPQIKVTPSGRIINMQASKITLKRRA